MPALDWALVPVFLALLETGSMGRAAQQLGLSQPTLSRRLAALEAALGHALFERTAQGLRPTGAALALQAPARRMQQQAAQLQLASQQHERHLAGSVRITASEAMSSFVLLPVLRDLRLSQPGIQIELVPSDRAEDLLQRQADIAVRMFRPTEPSLTVRRMADMPLAFFAGRAYLARRGVPSADNLLEHDWVGMDRADTLLKGFAAAGMPVAREFFGFRCDSSVVTWNAIAAGLGIGVGLQGVGERTPGVQRVLHELRIPPLPVWLAVHRELRGTPRLRLVFDALARALSA